MMVDFDYNSELDILTVDLESRSSEDYEESIPVGDYVIDVDDEGGFLGLEIINASQNLPFTVSELEGIEDVELEIVDRNEARTVSVKITYSDSKGKFSVGYGTVNA